MQDAQGLPNSISERPSSPPDALVSDVIEENVRLTDQNKRLSAG